MAWEDFRSKPFLQLAFALAGFARWLRVLNNLKGFESTGKPMLPILQAVPATIPFFFVPWTCQVDLIPYMPIYLT